MRDKITLCLTPEMLDALRECYDACAARLGRPPQNMAELLDLMELLSPGTPADTEVLRETINRLRNFQNHSQMPGVFRELRENSRIRN
jgi:hypothetical protein